MPEATVQEITPVSKAARPPSSHALDQGRFLPGAMLTNRYRILGLLGRGGMGEVYRAEDLTLGQVVALKFLPPGLERDETRLNHFLNEVRTARQVTHSNVCRVYDIGDVDGQHYLSMEYVDGEDLSLLLRRIGRLPKDKATQIARQLCAGIHAAHEQGILHRDLKPANVMIDGRGQVKITDFGLASLEEAIEPGEIAGTPAYMAPEQLAGEEVTVRSDLYALGLVLYELFTGKRAYEAATSAEIAKLHQDSTPAKPSSHVEGFDPAVERVILRCLEREPDSRPPSALAVAAAFPGGDPLAAALAAGETPSPQMVADAGAKGGLRPAIAVSCLAFILLAIAANAFLYTWTHLVPQVRPEKPPEVLAERAREVIERLTPDLPRTDDAFGYVVDDAYLDYLRENDTSPSRWAGLAPGEGAPAVQFWYRQSPRLMIPTGTNMRVGPSDPLPDVSGTVDLRLDPEGRLLRFRIVPPQVEDADEPPPAPDWPAVFAETGLNLESLSPTQPSWIPPDFSDSRAAWKGTYPGTPGIPIRVEAAAYRGRPVFFRIVEPWALPEREEVFEPSGGARVANVIFGILVSAIVILALLLARQNLRRGRGDRVGATRIALVAVGALLIAQVLDAHHVPSPPDEMGMIMRGLGFALLIGVAYWLTYVALEPFIRRRWPESLTAWNRLLAGRFRDPLVGRSILIGAVFVVGVDLLTRNLPTILIQKVGLPPLLWGTFAMDLLLGGRHIASYIPFSVAISISYPFFVVLVVLLLRVFLRRLGLAIGAFVVIYALLGSLGAELPLVAILSSGIFAAVMVVMLVRFGFLTLVVGSTLGNLFVVAPIYVNASAWYVSNAVFPMLFTLALILFGFYTSLGGRRVFSEGLFETEAEKAH